MPHDHTASFVERVPKFILIDSALKGVGGHYVDYAKEVLDAARICGFDTLLVTHRSSEPPDIGHACSATLSTTYLDQLHSVAGDGTRLARQALATAFRWREKAFEAIGVTKLPVALRRILTSLVMPAAILAALWRRRSVGPMSKCAEKVAADFIALFAAFDRQLDERDIVFLPSSTAAEVAAVVKVHQRSPHRPHWCILFRRDPDQEEVEDLSVLHRRRDRLALICRRIDPKTKLDLFADTLPLAIRYAEISQRVVRPAAIPVRSPSQKVRQSTDITVVGYFGDARAEKGFAYLPYIVAKAPVDLKFAIQSNFEGEPRMGRAHAELRDASSVELLGGPHLTADYHRHFDAIDAVIAPYDSRAYARRSSGVFAEALCRAKPTIVTAGTWMADILQDWEQDWLAKAAEPYRDGLKTVAMIRVESDQTTPVHLRSRDGLTTTSMRYSRAVGEPLYLLLDGPAGSGFDVIGDGGKVAALIDWRSLPMKTPKSAVGVIADETPAALAQAVLELHQHGSHYCRTAREIASSWAAKNTGAALVSTLRV